MRKTAPVRHPILDVMAERWSPRAFAPLPVARPDLESLFEAARWAASCFNEQPWAFVVARREDKEVFSRALDCLAERNRAWARHAGALVFSFAKREFARNGHPNRHAAYDVGQAVAQLALQATALGLASHQMAGFSQERVRETFGVPDGWEPMTAIAIGKPGRAEDLDEEFRRSEAAARTRNPQAEFLFEGGWSRPLAP